MLDISPKLINVEGNRIGTDKLKIIGTNISGKIGEDQFNRTGHDRNYKGMNKVHIGRFPTQLFTNIKNDIYKYVRYIND